MCTVLVRTAARATDQRAEYKTTLQSHKIPQGSSRNQVEGKHHHHYHYHPNHTQDCRWDSSGTSHQIWHPPLVLTSKHTGLQHGSHFANGRVGKEGIGFRK